MRRQTLSKIIHSKIILVNILFVFVLCTYWYSWIIKLKHEIIYNFFYPYLLKSNFIRQLNLLTKTSRGQVKSVEHEFYACNEVSTEKFECRIEIVKSKFCGYYNIFYIYNYYTHYDTLGRRRRNRQVSLFRKWFSERSE